MKKWLAFPSVQIALCIGIYGLVGYYLGRMAVVWTSPLFAAAIARPLMSLASKIRHKLRAYVWMPVHGLHYSFRDVTIRVVEDDDRCRWVNLADVRKIVGVTASDGALATTYPDKVKAMGKPAQVHMRDDALVAHLGKVNQPTALRLRTWVERNIAFPGRRVRKIYGIHVD